MAKKKPTLYDRLTTRRAVRIFWFVVAAPFVLLLLLLGLAALGAFGKLPTFEELENPKSNVASEVISEEGKTLFTYAYESGTFVDYTDLTPDVVAALVSTEDKRFYGHSGIDYISLVRVGFRTIFLKTLGLDRNQGGGSTITQQLAKNLYKTRKAPDRPKSRNPVVRSAVLVGDKLKEWVIAIRLEHNYTKEEIIAMYLNTMEYSRNAFGIKNAAHSFFNKAPNELNIQEAAMLVGMVNAPTRYDPVRNPENSLKRRNTVMNRMEDVGYITKAQLDSLSALPIELDYQPISHDAGSGTYFREKLRRDMQAKEPKRGDFSGPYADWDYGVALRRWETDGLYGWLNKNKKPDGNSYNLFSDGLKIYTTINALMQRYAEEAVGQQLKGVIQPSMDAQFKRSGVIFQKKSKKEIEDIIAIQVRQSDRYRAMTAAGASKEQIEAAFDIPVKMQLYSHTAGIRDTVITPRDSIVHFKKQMRASFVAMDPHTGYVKAYVGGPDYKYFKYDMASQGKRQPGSTIKPFVYTFAFSQLGIDPCTPVPNSRVTIETSTGEPWTPKEASEEEYDGAMNPLKWGLYRSRNNYTAWVMKQAGSPEAVADFIGSMGIRSYIYPVPALALGTMDVTLLELVGAYTTFANRGMTTEPIFVVKIEDRQGNLISSFLPDTKEAIDERAAYTTLEILQDVVNYGTGNRLRRDYIPTGQVGGKTGTTDEARDAWFVGVTPNLVAGTWVGAEDLSVHPYSRGEGSIVALPIYGEFMKRVYADPNLGVRPGDVFEVPPGGGIGCAGTDTSINTESLTPVADSVKKDEFFD